VNTVVGNDGEAFVAALLRSRGYDVLEIGGNYPVIDLEVRGHSPFRVSVKTSVTKRHVRMGKETSVSPLLDSDFVFALMPKDGRAFLDLGSDDYDLMILPGEVARSGALEVHGAYLAEPGTDCEPRSGSAGVMVKGYSRRPAQTKVWRSWLNYIDAWSALPLA
jgi:hypothetical protein